MPEIPEIGIKDVSVPEIPAWQALPPKSLPTAPPITLQIGFPVADVPGCVETRNSQPGNEEAYTNDPRGNFVVCDGTLPSYRPLDFNPGSVPVAQKKQPPPAVDPDLSESTKKPAGSLGQPAVASPSLPSSSLDISTVVTELPCPPPDAIPLGAKNKSQTAIIIGYERVEGKCEAILEPLDLPTIISNYSPGLPVVATTVVVTTIAASTAICAQPLGHHLLRIVRPTVKKTIKRINDRLGRNHGSIESVRERRQYQRSLRS